MNESQHRNKAMRIEHSLRSLDVDHFVARSRKHRESRLRAITRQSVRIIRSKLRWTLLDPAGADDRRKAGEEHETRGLELSSQFYPLRHAPVARVFGLNGRAHPLDHGLERRQLEGLLQHEWMSGQHGTRRCRFNVVARGQDHPRGQRRPIP